MVDEGKDGYEAYMRLRSDKDFIVTDIAIKFNRAFINVSGRKSEKVTCSGRSCMISGLNKPIKAGNMRRLMTFQVSHKAGAKTPKVVGMKINGVEYCCKI